MLNSLTTFSSGKTAQCIQVSPVLAEKLNNEAKILQQPAGDVFVKQDKCQDNKLSIYYYNDTHGNSDLIAELTNTAKDFKNRSKNTQSFVLSGGDNVSGGDVKKNEFIFDLMEDMIGVDVSAIGNHEIDAGAEGFFNAIKANKVTFVATNVKFEDEELKKHIKKSLIIEKNGIKYGFVGAMPIDFKSCTRKESQQGIEVDDFEATVNHLQEEIDNLKKQGVNKIIMLSHVSYATDRKLAQNLDGVDIIIGGHSHTVVDGAKTGENLLYSKSGEPVIITQAGENGKYYGNLNVEFDDNGIITKLSNQLTKTTNQEKKPTIEYIENSKLGKSIPIGTLTYIDPMPENRRITPCAWTSVIADSMRDEFDADIALINSANIRKVPKAGILTERDVTESTPMKNKLLKTKITQKQLVEAIQNAARATFSSQNGEPGLLQGSGFTYKIDRNGNLLEMYIVKNNDTKIPINIKNPSEFVTYYAVYDSFVAQKDGETPELYPKFKTQMFNYDKDETMIRYLLKSPDLDDIQIIYDDRIQIV